MNMDTISNTVKETAKSVVSSESKDRVDAEHELIQTQQDAIIENGDITKGRAARSSSPSAGKPSRRDCDGKLYSVKCADGIDDLGRT